MTIHNKPLDDVEIIQQPAIDQEISKNQHDSASQEMTPEQKKFVTIGVIVFILLIILTVISIYFLLQPSTDSSRIRDIFIIFIAIETLLIGAAFVVMMVQLAKLLNMLQNEIRPIAESTNETISNIRGTTEFMSDNLAEPVIKINQYMSAFFEFLRMVGLFKRPPAK